MRATLHSSLTHSLLLLFVSCLLSLLFAGGNAVARSEKIVQLGWKATRPDLWASLEEECSQLIAKLKSGELKPPAPVSLQLAK